MSWLLILIPFLWNNCVTIAFQHNYHHYISRKRVVLVAAVEYEAQMTREAISGLFGTLAVTGAAGSIWWNSVIPQKRGELARSKASGELRSLLDDIDSAPSDQMKVQRWFFTDWLKKQRGVSKPAPIPFFKKTKWNSGDNPILVAFGGIMATVVAASIAERTF